MTSTSSLTVAFTGTSSVLHSSFLPQILLDGDCKYSCALLNFIIKNCENLEEIIKSFQVQKYNNYNLVSINS